MEAIALGKGLYLKLYRKSLGLNLKKRVKLPHRALTDMNLLKFAKVMKIPHFRGVYMRKELPKSGPLKYKSAIVNLDDKDGPRTHWVAYRKINNQVIYFDSFGNPQPPLDLIEYLGVGSIIK